MVDIEIEFSNQICTFCVYNNFEKCGKIQLEKENDLSICKCLNYKRKDLTMEEILKKRKVESSKEWIKMQKFKKENCVFCKNKNSDLCEIRRNINNQLQCIYKEF